MYNNSRWDYMPLSDAVEIWDTLRKPINSKERASRIEGKTSSELFPYYGATGQVGYIDDYLIDGEYVLLGEDGAPFLDAFADKAYIVSGKAWVNNHAHIMRSKINNLFLCYYLNCFDFKDYVSGTTRLKLTQADMKRIPVPVTPVDVQERIVKHIEESLSQLDSAVETLKKTKQQLDIYRQAVLKEAFDGVLTESELTTFSLLKNYIEKPKYGTSKKCGYSITADSKPVYRIPNIDTDRLRIDKQDIKYAVFSFDELEKIDLIENDILIIRSNGSASLVGRAAIIQKDDIDATFAGYLMRLRIVNPAELLPKFLLWYLQTYQARVYIESKAKSTSGVHNINSDEISSLQIPVFAIEEQQKIVDAVESRMSEYDNIEQTVNQSLQQAMALRQSILKQAFEEER